MKALYIILLTILTVATQAQVRKLTLSDTNPETGSGFQGTKECCSYSFENSTAFVRFGNQSLKINLNKTDPPPTDGSGSLRAEKYKNYSSTIAGQDTTYQWYAFSMLSPRATNSTDPAEEIRFQLHSNVGSPVCALEIKNGIWRVARRNSSQPTPTYANGGYTDLDSINFDAWEDWIIQFRPRTTSDGIIKIWRNDTLMYSYTGVTNYSASNAIFPYPNIGIYKWPWASTWVPASTSTTRTFYLDSVFYASSAATYADMDVTPAGANNPPTISAGSNQIIANGVTSTNIPVTSTDTDGTISSESLTQVSGPNTSIIGAKSAGNYPVSNLIAGTYQFIASATDNGGATSTATMSVTVAEANQLPTVSITADPSYTGVNAVQLSASGSDADGTISSYLWERLDGPVVTIQSPNSSSTYLTGLPPGQYTYRVTVTDNNGGQGAATIYFEVYRRNIYQFRFNTGSAKKIIILN